MFIGVSEDARMSVLGLLEYEEPSNPNPNPNLNSNPNTKTPLQSNGSKVSSVLKT